MWGMRQVGYGGYVWCSTFATVMDMGTVCVEMGLERARSPITSKSSSRPVSPATSSVLGTRVQPRAKKAAAEQASSGSPSICSTCGFGIQGVEGVEGVEGEKAVQGFVFVSRVRKRSSQLCRYPLRTSDVPVGRRGPSSCTCSLLC
jgi:hypothetical protein